MMKTIRPLGHLPRTATSRHTHTFLPAQYLRCTNHNRQQQQARTFLSNPFAPTEPQIITATRTFAHPAPAIFEVIADVGAYSQYFPFCQHSIVTRSSAPHPRTGKQYPEEAKLVVGFHEYGSEEFWSRIYCVPDSVVEAVSGRTEPTVAAEQIGHHHARPSGGEGGGDPTRKDTLLSHLSTRWTLQPRERDGPRAQTDVSLRIEFQFANPLYAALSQAAVPKVADKMIEAFEKRLREVVKR